MVLLAGSANGRGEEPGKSKVPQLFNMDEKLPALSQANGEQVKQEN